MNPKLPGLAGVDGSGIRLGLCQVATVPWQVESNLGATLAALELAAAQGAEIAITPECVLTGYGIEPDASRQRELLERHAETVDGSSMRQIGAASRRLGIHVVVGFAERAGGGRFHNAAALVDREGEVTAVYRKVHCRRFESIAGTGAFTPGDRFIAVALPCRSTQVRLGLMICFDREVTESARCLRALGAELVACPLACDTTRLDSPGNWADNETVTRCRAAENEVFIAVVNHAARFNGGSFVVGPGGESLLQLGTAGEVAAVDLPVGGVRSVLHANPWGWMGWGYRRPDVYTDLR